MICFHKLSLHACEYNGKNVIAKLKGRKNEIENRGSSGSCYTKVENKSDKGKPVERRRRKATGLPL
ncbi:hypothetical protein ANRL2_03530 [Anaerolineae bacterium]|nr:hypothetical protein ANRL2_03530 [Anaerolineae bacterium]